MFARGARQFRASTGLRLPPAAGGNAWARQAASVTSQVAAPSPATSGAGPSFTQEDRVARTLHAAIADFKASQAKFIETFNAGNEDLLKTFKASNEELLKTFNAGDEKLFKTIDAGYEEILKHIKASNKEFLKEFKHRVYAYVVCPPEQVGGPDVGRFSCDGVYIVEVACEEGYGWRTKIAHHSLHSRSRGWFVVWHLRMFKRRPDLKAS